VVAGHEDLAVGLHGNVDTPSYRAARKSSTRWIRSADASAS
jgi:hypothetical protein